MKRYSFGHMCYAAESETGSWCKVADHNEEVAELLNALATLQFHYDLSDEHEDMVDKLYNKHRSKT